MLGRPAWILATIGAAYGVWRLTRLRLAHAAERGHQREGADEWGQAAHRVLILGGGFGGTATAVALDRRLAPDAASVLLVDRDGSLLFTPLLWTVADGRTDATNVVVPVRAFQRGRRFHVLHAEVERIDLDRREVVTAAGSLAYHTLVVAGGGDTGIELAATIHDYLASGLLASYPWLTDTPPRIVVVGRADRLVPMSDERTSAAVQRELEASGIEVL